MFALMLGMVIISPNPSLGFGEMDWWGHPRGGVVGQFPKLPFGGLTMGIVQAVRVGY